MFQLKHYVYGKKDEPCKSCGTMISKIVVGGRGTHFAPAAKNHKLKLFKQAAAE